MRNLAAAVRTAILVLILVAPASAANTLVGIWSSTLDYSNQKAGLHYTFQVFPNGRLLERTESALGMAYNLMGTYRMVGSTMHFTWTDYAPKQVCVGGNCTRMGPPAPLGVPHTSRIQFKNPNLFTGTTEDGVSTMWIRVH